MRGQGGWLAAGNLVRSRLLTASDNKGRVSLPRGFRYNAALKGDKMARITVEDCLENVPNRFRLVLLAARRSKQLLKGARPLVESDNKEVVSALREIAEGKVTMRLRDPEQS